MAFLQEARRLVHDNALLIISVPAFPSLWSEMDVLAGHRCRYRWQPLKTKMIQNGWIPEGHTHYQCLLFPLVWVSRRVGRFLSYGLERRPPRKINRLLGAINRFEVSIFDGISLPFGSSLVVWAKKGA